MGHQNSFHYCLSVFTLHEEFILKGTLWIFTIFIVYVTEDVNVYVYSELMWEGVYM